MELHRRQNVPEPMFGAGVGGTGKALFSWGPWEGLLALWPRPLRP